MEVCVPMATDCKVLPACTAPRMESFIAIVGECVRSASHMGLGIVHDLLVV